MPEIGTLLVDKGMLKYKAMAGADVTAQFAVASRGRQCPCPWLPAPVATLEGNLRQTARTGGVLVEQKTTMRCVPQQGERRGR
jgi:hypothetical protein